MQTDITKHLTLDIGGGQFHQCEVMLEHRLEGAPKLRMTALHLDEGTIGIARAVRDRLRAQHPGIRLSDAEAQQVLVSGHALIEGRRKPVDDIVSEAIAERSPTLLTHLRHQLQDERSFLMFTGGGSILLAPSLKQVVSASRKSHQSFLFVPKELASVLNAIGGSLLAQAIARRVVAHSPETRQTQ